MCQNSALYSEKWGYMTKLCWNRDIKIRFIVHVYFRMYNRTFHKIIKEN